MKSTATPVIVGVDLAKSVFQLAVADLEFQFTASHRLNRAQFQAWFASRSVQLVVMEACGSAHHWARWLGTLGIEVRLLPAAYVRAYVKRNKTDAADARALLEAARCADIHPVPVKSVEQQAVQGLHRVRSQWMATRTARINNLRGLLREFGIIIAAGARLGTEQISRVLADPDSPVPALIRPAMTLLMQEIRLLESRITQLERELTTIAKQSPACKLLLSIPGVGLLTATAMLAATGAHVTHFRSARHFAAWFGLTPREYSSGNSRQMGRITKRGDAYLRTLLIHGARSVLRAATHSAKLGKSVDPLRRWVLDLVARTNFNKAACALANKIARICYATLRDGTQYGTPFRLSKKINSTAWPVTA